MAVQCPECNAEFDPEQTADGAVECPECGRRFSTTGSGISRRASNGPGSSRSALWGSSVGETVESEEEYADISPGQELAGFRIEEKLGEGAMGLVFKATQLSLDRPVALKILPERFADNPQFVKHFDQESAALAALNHPNIVGIIDRGRVGKTYFFAMEYVEGTNLYQMLRSEELDMEFFLRIMKQSCEGLKYAHSRGIIHRDIKPSNIMIDDQGIAKLADFGLAGMLAEEQDKRGRKRRVSVGTHGFMPPEQEYDVAEADERSDIYAFGALMYTALTRKVPKERPIQNPRERNDEIDPQLDGIVMKCLSEEADQRYQSAEELLEALETYTETLTSVGELCPECGSQNPPSERECLECGADLSELFDPCPECGHENRRDVEICPECGSNIKKLQEQYSIQIGKVRDQAKRHFQNGEYDRAIKRLRSIQQVPGKVFEKAREKAAKQIEICERKKEEKRQDLIDRAQSLADDGAPQKALKQLQRLPSGDEEVAELRDDIKQQMERSRKLAGRALEHVQNYELEKAQELTEEAEVLWAECPQLQEALSEVQDLEEVEDTLDYEIQEAKESLEEKKYEEARESLQFARASVPDHPRLKQVLKEIDVAEKHSKLQNALKEGKRLFGEKRFEEAAEQWELAIHLMGDDDERKKKVQAKVQQAQKKARGPDAVGRKAEVEDSTRTRTEIKTIDSGRNRRRIAVVAGVVAALLLLGGGGFLFLSSAEEDFDGRVAQRPPEEKDREDEEPGEDAGSAGAESTEEETAGQEESEAEESQQEEPGEPEDTDADRDEPPKPDDKKPDEEDESEEPEEGDESEEPEEEDESEEPEIKTVSLEDFPGQNVSELAPPDGRFSVETGFSPATSLWEMVTGDPQLSENMLQSSGAEQTCALIDAVRGAEVDLRGRCRIDRIEHDGTSPVAALMARQQNGRNFIIMGLRAAEQESVEPFISAVRNGESTTETVSDPAMSPPIDTPVDMRLIVRRDRAIGMIDGKRMVELQNLEEVAPSEGRAGVYSRNMEARWDRFALTSAAMPSVTVPDDAEVEVGGDGVNIEKGSQKVITLDGLNAKDLRLEMTVELGEATSQFANPLIALHGRIQENGEDVYMAVELPPKKGQQTRVSMLRHLERDGKVKSVDYDKKGGPKLWHGDTAKLTFQMEGKRVLGRIDGEKIIAVSGTEKRPVVEEGGAWGMRLNYLRGVITELHISSP